MKAFENLAICLKVKQVGRTNVNGYIIQGFLKKSGQKTNYVLGKQFYKRYFILNFDSALIIVLKNQPEDAKDFSLEKA